MTKLYEIRQCESCGLRYPLNHGLATRCPICLGSTRLLLSRELVVEPKRDLTSSLSPNEPPFAVLLDNIRSAWNVGSILRTADGFGFNHAYLCGITPTPENDAVQKTSLGAEDSVTWSYHKDAVKLVKGLKKKGWRIIALEEGVHTQAQAIDEFTPQAKPTALILGSEVTGVDPDLLSLCDDVFYIPMRGEKKSFNVGIAFGIAAYQMRM